MYKRVRLLSVAQEYTAAARNSIHAVDLFFFLYLCMRVFLWLGGRKGA